MKNIGKWNTGAKRLTAALLALVLALSLAGCGKKEDKTSNLDFQTAPYYLQEDMPLPAETGELAGCCTDGKSIWYLLIPEEDAAPVLCRVPLDGGEAEILKDYCPPAAVDGDTVMGCYGPFWGGDGKLWVWEQSLTFVYSLPEDFDPEEDSKSGYITGNTEAFQLRQLDPAAGKELKTIDITAAMGELNVMYFNGLAVSGEGTLYLSDNKHVVAADGQGQVLFTLEEDLSGKFSPGSAGGKLALLPDGTVAACTTQLGGKRLVRRIDREAQDWGGEQYMIQSGAQEIFGGSGAYMFCYTGGNMFYGIAEGEKLPQRLISWQHTQLTDAGNVMCTALMEEGQAVVLTCTYESGDRYAGRIRALRLLPSEEAPDDGRIRLICATIGDDPYLSYRVKKFNRAGTYYVELRDYAEGMLGEGEEDPQIYSTAVARLYTDIASGHGPDILSDTLPLEALGKQGALEDLWPWIEGDPELGREAVMEHVLECMETGGKLYRICGSFAIDTAVTSAAVAGDRTGWTMEEMMDAFGGQMPEFYFSGNWDSRLIDVHFARFDKRSMLFNLAGMSLDRYVDRESGACSFDSEDFRSVLTLSGLGQNAENVKMGFWPEEGFTHLKSDVMEISRVFPWEGEPLLYARTLQRPWDLVLDDVLFGGRESLTDYDQRLWDAGILFHWFNSYQNAEDVGTHVRMGGVTAVLGTIADTQFGLNSYFPLAADYVVGAADGNTYASFVGFPTQSGTGSSFSVNSCAGISAKSEVKDGAWAFIRSLLCPGSNVLRRSDDEKFPWVQGFPMNRADFESQIQPEVRWCVNQETGEPYLDANGEKIETTDYALGIGSPIVMMAYLMPPTQAQTDRFWDLYNAIDHVTGENDELLNIICDQAEAYFAGDKSLDETVRLIQNRAKLYMDETR